MIKVKNMGVQILAKKWSIHSESEKACRRKEIGEGLAYVQIKFERCKSGPIEIIRLRNIEQPLEFRLCSVRDSIELSDDAEFLTYDIYCFS